MSRTPSQHALARRALPEDDAGTSNWTQRGVAVLGITVLGLGVAGSVAVTGNAQNATASGGRPVSTAAAEPSVSTSVAPGVSVPSAFDRRAAPLSRAAGRPALAASATSRDADRRALGLLVGSGAVQRSAQAKAVALRDKTLIKIADATEKKDTSLHQARAEAKKAAKEAKAKAKAEKAKAERAKRVRAAQKSDSGSTSSSSSTTSRSSSRSSSSSGSGSVSLPITSGYHIAARFGDTGSWSRYHTGLDFAAGMGTPIHAAASGTVTHAGSGSAGWAGHYVTIRHADGKTSLYAHMSTVSVHEGQHVSGGQRVGAVGMTGRTFGPHVHFEIYPVGAKVGSPYEAINPAPWLRARGLHF